MKPVKLMFLTVGFASLILAIAGIFLPLLPTTPFLILSAVCFDRASPRFHAWLVNHKYFGPPIQDWKKTRTIRLPYKILATVMLLGSVIFVLMNPTYPASGKAIFFVFVAGVSVFIWTRKS